MSRLLALLLVASSGIAHAQWDVPTTRHREDLSQLEPLADERGYLRVPRLVIGAHWIVPDRDHGDDLISIGAAGSLGVDVALGVAFSVGAYARAGWWREGRDDYASDRRDHALFDLGVKARARASVGTFTFFLGGHGGLSHEWTLDNDAHGEGFHVGAHAGIHVGNVVATEIEVGLNHRDIGGQSWIEAYGSLAMTIALRSVR